MIHPTLLILAAGMGSRYGGLKLTEPVGPGGESIMDYSIFDARRAGFGRIILVIRSGIEQQIKERIGERFEKHVSVEYLFQEVNKLPHGFHAPAGRTRPWGTTHAILMATGVIHEPFGVINADDFYGVECYRALDRHLQSGTGDFASVGFTLRNTLSEYGSVARGICQVDPNGFLENIQELKRIERDGGHAKDVDAEGRETRLTGNEMVSMNMWGFTPEVFPLLNEHFQKFLFQDQGDLDTECFIPNTINEILLAGQARVRVLRCEESWFGITYREDNSLAAEKIRRLIEAGHYPKKLW